MNKLYLTFILSLLPTVTLAADCKVLDPDIAAEYSGACQNGLANGYGVAKGRDQYKGQFKNGKEDGYGVYIWADGSRYDGQYKNGKPNGHGVHIWANGSRYDGQYKDGKRNGRGTISLVKADKGIASYETKGYGKWAGNTYVVTAFFSDNHVTRTSLNNPNRQPDNSKQMDTNNPRNQAIGAIMDGLFGYTKDIATGKILADTVGTVKNAPRISDAKSACLDRCDADERNTKAGCTGLNDNFKLIGLNDKNECMYQASSALHSCKNSCYSMP